MKIEHIALWCADLEVMKDFYVTPDGNRCIVDHLFFLLSGRSR